MKGVLGEKYHKERLVSPFLKYRMKRRAQEAILAIKNFALRKCDTIWVLDVGCADGMMLKEFHSSLGNVKIVGLEYSYELLKFADRTTFQLVSGDAAKMPFRDEQFDAVVGAAIIEHLESPVGFVKECLRVLRDDGIVFLTTPDPKWERLATAIGHLNSNDHTMTFTLKSLSQILQSNGFEILSAKKFMVSPVGFPFESKIENALSFLRMDFFLLNQAVVGRKVYHP